MVQNFDLYSLKKFLKKTEKSNLKNNEDNRHDLA